MGDKDLVTSELRSEVPPSTTCRPWNRGPLREPSHRASPTPSGESGGLCSPWFPPSLSPTSSTTLLRRSTTDCRGSSPDSSTTSHKQHPCRPAFCVQSWKH